jgi:hypothetical protein
MLQVDRQVFTSCLIEGCQQGTIAPRNICNDFLGTTISSVLLDLPVSSAYLHFTHQAIAWSGLVAVGKWEILANFAIYMITAAAAGVAIHLAVEKPLTQYGIGLIRRKPSTPAVARWAGKAFPLNAWSSLDRSAKPFDL